MNNIKSYIILNKNSNLITKLFLFISIIIIIVMFVVFQIKYSKYYQTVGQVIEENNIYQLSLYLDPYKLKILKNNNKIIIDNEEYFYSKKYIDNKYLISNNLDNYINVILDVNLNKKDRIVNYILNVKILESNKKIICYLKEYLKKGVGYEKY